MLLIYLKMAIRNLIKDRMYSLINLGGLTIGIAVCVLLALFIGNDLSYDSYHPGIEKIHRLGLTASYDGTTNKWGSVPNIAGPHFREEIAAVEEQARVLKHNFGRTAFLTYDGNHLIEEKLFWTDSSLFDILDIPLVLGGDGLPLTEPNQVVLSESSAKRIFGSTDPLGEVIRVDNSLDLNVVGVFEDFPGNSSLQANMFATIQTLGWASKRLYWGNASFETYLRLTDPSQMQEVEKQMALVLDKAVSKEDQWFSFWLQPYAQAHLYSEGISNTYLENVRDIKQVKLLAGLALIILFLACFNYINMSTARARRRAKEVGINKTLGAGTAIMARRFLIETGALVLAAMGLGLILALLATPLLANISGQPLDFGLVTTGGGPLWLIALWIGITFIAGLYPAFILSRARPQEILMPSHYQMQQGSFFRKVLVVGQFTVCLALIAVIMLFHRQMNFISEKKLGYQPDQVIAISTAAAERGESIQSLMNALTAEPDIQAVCRSSSYPGLGTAGYAMSRPGEPDKSIHVASTRATEGIEDLLDLKLIAGRPLPAKRADDTTVQIIVNETAIEFLGWSPEEALGKEPPDLYQYPTSIVGVVEDFHFQSLHQPITPYVINNGNELGWRRFLLVKLSSSQLTRSLQKLEDIFRQHIPNSAFKYNFLDEQVASLYGSERRLLSVVLVFTILAIFISFLGLFGLATFNAEKRVKEIGVRKVLGAATPGIVWLLSKDIFKLALIAVLIGVPLAWFFADRWLQEFSYRIEPDIGTLTVATVVSLLIGLVSVGIQALRASWANPIDSLRNE